MLNYTWSPSPCALPASAARGRVEFLGPQPGAICYARKN